MLLRAASGQGKGGYAQPEEEDIVPDPTYTFAQGFMRLVTRYTRPATALGNFEQGSIQTESAAVQWLTSVQLGRVPAVAASTHRDEMRPDRGACTENVPWSRRPMCRGAATKEIPAAESIRRPRLDTDQSELNAVEG